MTFADGVEFADAQDFSGAGIDHDFLHEDLEFGNWFSL